MANNSFCARRLLDRQKYMMKNGAAARWPLFSLSCAANRKTCLFLISAKFFRLKIIYIN